MTPRILQSDIDLAKRMLQAGAPDAEVVVALMRRRIDQENAAWLVNELRQGHAASPQLELSPEGTVLAPEAAPSPPPAPHAAPGPAGESRKRRHVRRSSGARKIGMSVGVLLIASGLGGAILTLYKQYHTRTGALLEHLESVVNGPSPSPADNNPAVSNRTAEASGPPEVLSDYQVLLNQLSRRRLDVQEKRRLEVAIRKEQQRAGPRNASALGGVGAPELEIRPDGLHIGATMITARSALQALCRAVGPPARTNQVEQSTNSVYTVYAFDSPGLLLYSQTGADADYIVLDFDANGGNTGTTSPFLGTLKIDSTVIGRKTDSQSLSAASVNLNRTDPGGGIFQGTWQGTELYVAYLKNQQRPSLIQINLKKPE